MGCQSIEGLPSALRRSMEETAEIQATYFETLKEVTVI